MHSVFLVLIFAAFLCAIPAIVVFLISPGGIAIRLCGSFATIVCFLIAAGVAWYGQIPPSEPLIGAILFGSFFAGWRAARFLHRKTN